MADAHDTSDPRAQRLHRRFPVDWRVTLRVPSWGVETRVAADNVSRGGLFVLTSRPPPAGTPVELDVGLPDGSHALLKGTVQHVVTPERALVQGRSPGVGIRVEEKYAVDLMLLEEMAMVVKAVPKPIFDAGHIRRRMTSTTPVGRVQLVGVSAARVVGIDLGTSVTRLACAVGDRVVIATDAEGSPAVPSVTAYPVDGPSLVGWEALDQADQIPRRTVTQIKRLLGRQFVDAAGDVLPIVDWHAVAGDDGTVRVDLEDRTVPAVDVAGTILQHVRAMGERSLKRGIRAALLTCASGTSAEGRDALRTAAAQAQLEVVDVVDEPIAVARAYGAGLAGDELCAVFDWGGGQFAFTVLEVAGGVVRIVDSAVDPHLAGDELDEALADHVADRFWRATTVEVRQSLGSWRRLLAACEDAKRILSIEHEAPVRLPALVVSPEPLDLDERVTRADLESATGMLVERALAVCSRVLERSALRPDALSRVLPAGGIACVPLVRHALERFTGRPLATGVAPEEAVVHGAARLAATRSA